MWGFCGAGQGLIWPIARPGDGTKPPALERAPAKVSARASETAPGKSSGKRREKTGMKSLCHGGWVGLKPASITALHHPSYPVAPFCLPTLSSPWDIVQGQGHRNQTDAIGSLELKTPDGGRFLGIFTGLTRPAHASPLCRGPCYRARRIRIEGKGISPGSWVSSRARVSKPMAA